MVTPSWRGGSLGYRVRPGLKNKQRCKIVEILEERSIFCKKCVEELSFILFGPGSFAKIWADLTRDSMPNSGADRKSW